MSFYNFCSCQTLMTKLEKNGCLHSNNAKTFCNFSQYPCTSKKKHSWNQWTQSALFQTHILQYSIRNRIQNTGCTLKTITHWPLDLINRIML